MSETDLMNQTILGYHVEEKLGSGNFGTVYRAVKRDQTGEYVRALKHIMLPTEKQYNDILNSMGGDCAKANSYFSDRLSTIGAEINILSDLSEKEIHHVVRYYEHDIITMESPRRYDVYILMELLTPLVRFIQDSRDFLVRDVVKLGQDILDGLRSCHENGVMHRDIKDDNIFVSEKGEYKIGDFGVSKVLKHTSIAETYAGTPDFQAPEVQYRGAGYIKSVDLYSLGIVLYRMLNHNRNPFLPRYPEQYFPQDEDAAFAERMKGTPPEPPDFGGGEIGKVIVKAISNQEERFQTAQEFMDALDAAVKNTPETMLNQSVKEHIVSPMSVKRKSEPKPVPERGRGADTIYSPYMPEEPVAKRKESDGGKLFTDVNMPSGTEKPDPQGTEDRKFEAKEEQIRLKKLVLISSAVVLVLAVIAGVSILGGKREMQTEAEKDRGQGTAEMAMETMPPEPEPTPEMVSVPGLAGHEENSAREILAALHLNMSVKEEKYSEEVGAGRVIAQEPTANASLETGGMIYVVISRGPRRMTVPYVEGMSAASAKKKLKDAGLKVAEKKEYHDIVSSGTVVSQSVNAGEEVKKNTKVTIVVSKGAKSKLQDRAEEKTPVQTKPSVQTKPIPKKKGSKEKGPAWDVEPVF